MTIRTKITLKEYTRLLFPLIYRKPMMIVILCAGAAVLAWIVGYALGLEFLPKPLVFQYITLVLIVVVQPLMIFLTIRRTFISSNHLGESLSMEFDPERIRMTGDSFYMEVIWAKTFKVVELRNWFMIYQNTMSAIIVPKRSFAPGEADQFRRMVRDIPGLDLHMMR
ncbi:MAG: YcxB family protein [Flavobacteriales bacterium]|nr:YcxB family protein [Flavobacteriales bacterium]MBP7450973.1 YcxB family protein [Flavobacteriales bacterium]